MTDQLKAKIKDFLGTRIDVVGFGSVDRFVDAPPKHHPAAVCKDAQTVIVLGKLMPKGVLSSPDYNLHLLHRSYHSLYPFLDMLGVELSNLIETEGYYAVPIPAFAPMVFHEAEPWGIISLKHAAVAAGLGSFGRNEVVFHPQHGALVRYGAVITNAVIEPDPLVEGSPCPPNCRACVNNCPSKALGENSFAKMVCNRHAIRHAIYPVALKKEDGTKYLEVTINTAGYNYWIGCDECLKVCPNNR